MIAEKGADAILGREPLPAAVLEDRGRHAPRQSRTPANACIRRSSR